MVRLFWPTVTLFPRGDQVLRSRVGVILIKRARRSMCPHLMASTLKFFHVTTRRPVHQRGPGDEAFFFFLLFCQYFYCSLFSLE